MRVPTCPAHGRLVLDLALGRLDDEPAMQAEALRGSCPHCRAWWQEEVEGDAARGVDQTVSLAFADFVPSHRHSTRWLAVAAALVATLALALLWQTSPAPGPSPTPAVAVNAAPAAQPEAATVSPAAPAQAEGTMFASGFESGDVGRWEKVSAPPAPAAPPSRALFSDSLESGSLTGWTAVQG